MKLKTGGVIAAGLFILPAILPAEIYQYTGNNFSTVSGSYLITESVTATFTLADPLATSATAVLTPISWTVNDGVNSLNDEEDCDTLETLTLTTDADGNITDWYFSADDGMSTVAIFSAGPTGETSGSYNLDSATTNTDNATTTSPGTWTPEPGTLSTMLAGAILLATMRRQGSA